MKPAIEILKEVAKEKGIDLAEKGIMEAFGILEAAAPRLALEAEEPVFKTIGGLLAMVVPAVKPSIEKLADLDKDGKIG